MKKNIILVVNPVAGGMDKSEIIEETSLFADQEGLNFVQYVTTGNDDISKGNASLEYDDLKVKLFKKKHPEMKQTDVMKKGAAAWSAFKEKNGIKTKPTKKAASSSKKGKATPSKKSSKQSDSESGSESD